MPSEVFILSDCTCKDGTAIICPSSEDPPVPGGNAYYTNWLSAPGQGGGNPDGDNPCPYGDKSERTNLQGVGELCADCIKPGRGSSNQAESRVCMCGDGTQGTCAT